MNVLEKYHGSDSPACRPASPKHQRGEQAGGTGCKRC